mgnify:CR=1
MKAGHVHDGMALHYDIMLWRYNAFFDFPRNLYARRGVYRVTWIYRLSFAPIHIYHKMSNGSTRFERKILSTSKVYAGKGRVIAWKDPFVGLTPSSG